MRLTPDDLEHLQDILADLPDGEVVVLPGGEISQEITIPSGITLVGPQAGVKPADSLDRGEEIVFKKPIVVEGDVSLDGVVLEARPTFGTNVDSINITNTIFRNITVETTSHLTAAVIGIPTTDTPVKMVITDSYFGDCVGVYNTMEVNAPFAKGTEISRNIFAEQLGSHNIVNIYKAEDGAVINVNDNYFIKSANAVRVGLIGAPADIEINLNNNKYDITDAGDYAGLMFIQPYGKATTSMGDVLINMNNTQNNSGEPQLWYYYSGAADAKLDVVDRPSVYIDGVLQPYSD